MFNRFYYDSLEQLDKNPTYNRIAEILKEFRVYWQSFIIYENDMWIIPTDLSEFIGCKIFATEQVIAITKNICADVTPMTVEKAIKDFHLKTATGGILQNKYSHYGRRKIVQFMRNFDSKRIIVVCNNIDFENIPNIEDF